MSLSIFNAVPAGAVEVLTGATGTPHFKRADLGRFLGLARIKDMFGNVKTASRRCIRKAAPSSPLLQGQNDHDAFVDLEAALEIVIRSKKPKAVELTKWLTRKGAEKVVEEHRKALDEKNTQIALLDDDLTLAQQDVLVLEQDNLELRAEIERLMPRAVPHLEDPRRDNGLVIIQKGNDDPHPYLAICGQQSYVAQKNPKQTRRLFQR